MVDDSSTSERDKQLLRQTLALIARHDGDYRPENYAVWYAYARDQASDLRAEVDQALDAQGRLPEEVSHELYRRYMATASERALLQTRARLSESLAEARHDMGSAVAEAQRFGSAVGDFERTLEQPVDRQKLRDGVARIARATEALASSLSEMDQKLLRNRQAMERLNVELARAQQEALTDALSGLSNRRALEIALQQWLGEPAAAAGEHRVTRQPLSMLMLDIDHFKGINDRYGHLFGDQVIQGIAQLILSQVKGKDLAVRYGGEEFAIVLTDTPLESALIVAEHLRQAIESSRIRRHGQTGSVEHVTVSVGVATHQPGESGERLIARADSALYRAKRAGRNRVVAATIDPGAA
jgi:diguanylate cyclase